MKFGRKELVTAYSYGQLEVIGNQFLNNRSNYASVFSADDCPNPESRCLVFGANIIRNHVALGQIYGSVEPIIRFLGARRTTWECGGGCG